MLIYYLVWFILSVLAVIEVCAQRKQKTDKMLLIGAYLIAWTLLVWITGFKGNVGTDYLSYKKLFYDTVNADYTWEVSSIEPLYWFWMKLCSMCMFSFPLFWFLTALLNISIKFYVMKFFSPFVSVSLLIYLVGLFFERDFDGVRQGLAISFCYIACMLYVQGKGFIYYTSVILVASLIHYTSILFMLIPILGYLQIQKRVVYFIVLIGIIAATLNWDFIDSFFKIFGTNNVLYEKLYAYIISDEYSQRVGFSLGIVFRIIVLLLFVKYGSQVLTNKRMYNLLKNGLLLSVVLSVLFANFDILSHRLGYGFREFQIFIIPYFILIMKNLKSKLLAVCIVSLYSFVLLERILITPGLTNAYQYETIF